jgi:hypothetical protein
MQIVVIYDSAEAANTCSICRHGSLIGSSYLPIDSYICGRNYRKNDGLSCSKFLPEDYIEEE